MGQSQAAAASASAETVVFADNAPSWDELAALLAERKAAVGFEEPDPATGPTNAQALVRHFGRGEDAVKIKLYRDHAAWCPYCHKVWLQLEEKRVPYRIEKINMRCYGDKPAAFLSKVPSGLLPVLEVDGQVSPRAPGRAPAPGAGAARSDPRDPRPAPRRPRRPSPSRSASCS